MDRILIIIILANLLLPAQNFVITKKTIDNYPNLDLEFLLLDANGEPDFSSEVELFNINGLLSSTKSCPQVIEPKGISSILTIDVSNSMRGDRLDIARSAALEWVDKIDLIASEVAVTSFSDNSYVNQDFTSRADLLERAINELVIVGGTNYTNGIYGQSTSPTQIATDAEQEVVIIFLTDGTSELDYDAALAELNGIDAKFFAISLLNRMSEELKSLSEATGGLFFEAVQTKDEMIAIYNAIRFIATGGEPCKIAWKEGGCQNNRSYRLEASDYDIETEFELVIEDKQLVGIEVLSKEIFDHGVVEPGTNSEAVVEIGSGSFEIDVESIRTVNPRYEIVDWGGSAPPFTMQPGERRSLTVRFTPQDRSRQFATFLIEADICSGKYFYQLGGDPDIAPADREITLTRPNGGERFEVGSSELINWEGTSAEEKVCIEYSIDNGRTWNYLGEGTGGEFNWADIPDTPSDQCLARITLRGNTAEEKKLHIKTDGSVRDSDSKRGLGYMHQDPEGNIIFSGYYFRDLEIEGIDPLSDPDNLYNKIHISKFDKDLNLLWQKDIEKSETCRMGLRALEVDNQGNIILGGFFSDGDINFESGPPLSADIEIYKFWLAKYDPNGELINAEESGGSREKETEGNEKEVGFETIQSIETDEFGMIYISGIAVNDFEYQFVSEPMNDGTELNLKSDFFIAKLNSDLSYISHTNSSNLNCEFSKLKYFNGKLVLAINYVAQGFMKSTDGNDKKIPLNIPFSRNTDVYITEFDRDLRILQTYDINGQNRVMMWDMEFDRFGDLVIAGSFVVDVDFPDGSEIRSNTQSLNTDIFLLKLDGTGPDYKWVKQFGSNNNNRGWEVPRSIDIDESGRILLAGSYVGEFEYEGALFKQVDQSYKTFTMMFDPNGELEYSSAPDFYNSVGNNAPYEAEFVEGGYLLSGFFANSIFDDPNFQESGGTGDQFISRFGFEESLSCQELISGGEYESQFFERVLEDDSSFEKNSYVLDLEYDDLGNKYILANIDNDCKFKGVDIVSSESGNFFLAKIDQSDRMIWILKSDRLSSESSDRIKATDIELMNNAVYLTGEFKGSFELNGINSNYEINNSDANEPGNIGREVFITKVDLNGQIEFIDIVEDASSIFNPYISKLSDDRIALAFQFWYENDLIKYVNEKDNIEITPNSTFGIGILKLDEELKYSNHFTIGLLDQGSREIIFNEIKTDAFNNIFLTGSFKGSFLGTQNTGFRDIFIAKFNNQNELNWLRIFDVNQSVQRNSLLLNPIQLEVNSNNEIVFSTQFSTRISSFISGSGSNDIDYKTPDNTIANSHLILAKFSQDGDLIWFQVSEQIDPTEGFLANPTELFVDKSDNIHLGVFSSFTFTFSGEDINTDRLNRAFSLILDSEGRYLDRIPLQGEITPYIYKISAYQDQITIGGSFDRSISLPGSSEVFSSKFGNRIGFYSTLSRSISADATFDISDDLWEIFKSSPALIDDLSQIDMGTVLVDRSKEKMEPRFISNIGSSEFIIESVSFPDSDRFSLVSGLPISVPSSESRNLEFAFKPDRTGFFESRVIFATNSGTFSTLIFGNGVDDNIEIVNNPIDFGKVTIQTDGRTLQREIIKYSGTEPLVLSNVSIIGPDVRQFSLNSISGNIIESGGSLSANLTFSPNFIGKSSSILALVTQNSSQTYLIDLHGEGIELDNQRFDIFTEEIEAEMGDIINVPIYVNDIEELIRRRVDTIYTELSFNESLIYPIETSQLGTTYGRVRTIPLLIDINTAVGDQIAEIPMIATLGDEQSTVLDLSNSFPIDTTLSVVASVYFDEIDGEFRLSDICWDGGSRLLSATSKFSIEIFPNPVKEEVKIAFGIIESSEVRISIYTASGSLVEEIYSERLEYGFYEEEFELDLPNGSYILVINTISGGKSINFQVVR